MEASAEMMINRPIEEVWKFISNIDNMGKWVKGITETLRTSEGEFGAGSTFQSKYTYRKKAHDITYEVTRFVPPNQMIVRSTSGPFSFEDDVELEQSGNVTFVRNTVDAGPDSTATSIMFALLGPYLRILMRRQLRKELRELKAILEQDVSR